MVFCFRWGGIVTVIVAVIVICGVSVLLFWIVTMTSPRTVDETRPAQHFAREMPHASFRAARAGSGNIFAGDQVDSEYPIRSGEFSAFDRLPLRVRVRDDSECPVRDAYIRLCLSLFAKLPTCFVGGVRVGRCSGYDLAQECFSLRSTQMEALVEPLKSYPAFLDLGVDPHLLPCLLSLC